MNQAVILGGLPSRSNQVSARCHSADRHYPSRTVVNSLQRPKHPERIKCAIFCSYSRLSGAEGKALNTADQRFAGCSRFSKCLIFLAILLVLFSAIAQAIHFHPTGTGNEIKNCAVCQLAVATALAILVIALPILRRQLTFVFCSEQPQAGSIFGCFNLFSRPPPVA